MIRVLIADDEDMIRTALAALLSLEDDLEVVAQCSDGESAVERALDLRPDVCLLDLEMPGIDGVEAAARIRQRIPARFARQDYVEEAWRIVDPVLGDATPVYEYEPGTWGPAEAESMLAPDGGWTI